LTDMGAGGYSDGNAGHDGRILSNIGMDHAAVGDEPVVGHHLTAVLVSVLLRRYSAVVGSGEAGRDLHGVHHRGGRRTVRAVPFDIRDVHARSEVDYGRYRRSVIPNVLQRV